MLRRRMPILVGLCLIAAGVPCSAATAAGTPGWQIVTFANPTAFSSSDEAGSSEGKGDGYALIVSNVGGASTNGSTITLTDRLPAGVTLTETESFRSVWTCSEELGAATVTCTISETVGVMGQLPALRVFVRVGPNVPADSTLTNSVTVSGGGAPVASAAKATTVNPSTPLSFGVADLTSFLTDLSGAPDTQAADHPTGLTTSFDVTNVFRRLQEEGRNETKAVQDWKDVVVDLPPGVVGNPQVAVQCPVSSLVVRSGGGPFPDSSACPVASQVGTIGLSLSGDYGGGKENIPVQHGP